MLLLFHVLVVLQWYYTAIGNECTIQNRYEWGAIHHTLGTALFHYKKEQLLIGRTLGCDLSYCSDEGSSRISHHIGEETIQ